VKTFVAQLYTSAAPLQRSWHWPCYGICYWGRAVVRLQASEHKGQVCSHKCHFIHAVLIHDSNHTHSLLSFQYSWLHAMTACIDREKLHFQKWKPYRPKDILVSCKGGRNGPPITNQGPLWQGQKHPYNPSLVQKPTHLPLSHPFCRHRI